MKPAGYFALALVALGLIGIHFKVEGAGWTLALGLCAAAFGDNFA